MVNAPATGGGGFLTTTSKIGPARVPLPLVVPGVGAEKKAQTGGDDGSLRPKDTFWNWAG